MLYRAAPLPPPYSSHPVYGIRPIYGRVLVGLGGGDTATLGDRALPQFCLFQGYEPATLGATYWPLDAKGGNVFCPAPNHDQRSTRTGYLYRTLLQIYPFGVGVFVNERRSGMNSKHRHSTSTLPSGDDFAPGPISRGGPWTQHI